MGDNLPLLPEREAICTDVRPVLREVFRDEDYLPPIADCYPENHDDKTILEQKKWVDEFSSECEKFHEKEKNLKYKYAQRLSREPLPNIFKIYSDLSNGSEDSWTVVRKDLKPTIEQDAGCNTSLWVKNILSRSSGDLTVRQHEPKIPSGEAIFPPDDVTIQSYSIGEAVPRPPPPPPKLAIQPPQPEYILCVPPRIEFVNFTLGHVHTETLRLINVSKFEIRLSVTPPKRKELDVELCSRLVVTSGSAAEFRIHYRPVDVRAVADVLQVRVSVGRGLLIPISCYMRPPVLEILVPNLTSVRLDSTNATETSADVLDLGSRLLGDVHRASVLFYCAEKHASFFLLPEDAWFSFCVDVAASSGKGKSVGGAASDNFWLSPVRWCGGGTTRAIAVCYAAEPGLHTTALRILSSTAIVRPLNLVADALWFRPTHITLLAHEKDYDICSADDPACEYYVRLGTAFPGRPLSSVIEIVNHSPLSYPYYWSVRAWGVCSCWTGSETSLLAEDDLCDEAKMLKRQKGGVNEDARAVRVESANGRLFPRSVTQLHVQVPDAGHLLGQHRAVLMLILKAVPKESFPPNYDAMIVKTEVVNEEGIPGVCSSWSREVCDIVCCQLEVWWDVVPVRFVLEPPVLKLTHSRRIKSTDICLKATQLYGVTGVKASWNVSGSKAINLLPGEAVGTNFNLQMQQLANHYPDLDVIELNAASKEWKSSCVIQRCYNTRHPSLRPALKWLGLVPPGAKVQTELVVHNDTYQHICWWVTCVRWWGERRVADVCASRAPCPQCYERSCSCAMISPTRGALAHDQKVTLKYSVIAPDIDGVVATLIQVHRTSGDVCMVPSVAGTEARATLLAYRVLAPVVVLQVLPCLGDKHKHCKVCSMDTNERKNCAVLRPSFALTAGFRSCYRLKCTNLTLLPTTVKWRKLLEGEDNLRVIFLPNDFDLRGHSSIEIQVVLDPRKVARRRIYSVHADVTHAYKPVHLLIDAAISGLEVVVDIPTGDGVKTDSFFSIKMMEKESARREKMVSPTELFEEEDRKRAVQKENICHCPYKMVYIPPATEPSSPLDEEYRCVDVITEPPPLTRVCPCGGKTKPVLPESEEPSCLQFRNLPVRTAQTRTMKLRNLSSLFTRIATAVRNWPRVHKRTLRSDKWADDVRTPGVIIECKASENALAPCGMVEVTVSVYADCWGLYHDQVLIMIDNVDSIVLDVWIEVVGPPLYFPLQGQCHDACTPILWMSSSDRERALVVANPSRSCLNVQTYVITENQYPQDELPFRLYLRFYYVPSRTCPCATALDSISYADEDSDQNSSSEYQEMETEIELYLARDYGVQDNINYTVEPREFKMEPNSTTTLQVTISGDPAPPPPTVILMRLRPLDNSGPGWHRPEPPPLTVRLLAVTRLPKLLVMPKQLIVRICALDLPANDILRIRKRLRVMNTGSGPLQAFAITECPWFIRVAQEQCDAKCLDPGPGSTVLNLDLLARSSTEIAIEVTIVTEEMWPKPQEDYERRRCITNELRFFDDQNIFLMSVPLQLAVEYPQISVEPSKIDFGYVMDGDRRKTFFTVMQTSFSATMEVVVECLGKDYQTWPPNLTLAPRCRERVYVQYIARFQLSPVEGLVKIRAFGSPGSWCAVAVQLRAQTSLDRATHLPVHDHTDDSHLLFD